MVGSKFALASEQAFSATTYAGPDEESRGPPRFKEFGWAAAFLRVRPGVGRVQAASGCVERYRLNMPRSMSSMSISSPATSVWPST